MLCTLINTTTAGSCEPAAGSSIEITAYFNLAGMAVVVAAAVTLAEVVVAGW